MNTEIWKPIENYSGYEISNFGQIRSYKMDGNGFRKLSKTYHILNQISDKRGYKRVTLCNNGIHRNFTIHKLVMNAFVGACPPKQQCRHLDGNPSNNKLQNLCWGTPIENAYDRRNHGTEAHGTIINTNKLSEQDVFEIRKQYQKGINRKTIAKTFGINLRTVYKVSKKETWKWL